MLGGINTLVNCNKVEYDEILGYSSKLTKGRKDFENPLMFFGVTCQPAATMQPKWAVGPELVSKQLPMTLMDFDVSFFLCHFFTIFLDFVMLNSVAI